MSLQTDNNDVPFTDLTLNPQEQERYLDLLMTFYKAQEGNHGAESQVNASLDALVLLDQFIAASAAAHGVLKQSPGVERLFNVQAADGILSINDHLSAIARKRQEALRIARERSGIEGVLDVLRKGGAQIVDNGLVLVRTNPARAHLENNGGDGSAQINIPEEKFAKVTDLLLGAEVGGQRIYMDDLVVQKGEVDKHVVRSRPYNVIQIPKINKEIAVCDLKGQAMFVSPQIHGPKLYAVMNKQELEHVMGMIPVTSHAGWEDRMLGALSTDVPEAAQKVDVADFAKKQKSAVMPLSPEIVGLALLKYAVVHNGKMATTRTPYPVPDMPLETWSAMQAAGYYGFRMMPKNMNLAAVKRYYGWYDAQSRPQPEEIASDITHYQATGEMPQPVISIEEAVQADKKQQKKKHLEENPLSPEIVGLALLKYAVVHNGKMATTHTPYPVPDMPLETWKALDSAGYCGIRMMSEGMSLHRIKVICGWQGEGAHKPAGAYLAQLNEDMAYLKEHGEMSDNLKDRIARGVETYVVHLEAQQDQTHEYNEPQDP